MDHPRGPTAALLASALALLVAPAGCWENVRGPCADAGDDCGDAGAADGAETAADDGAEAGDGGGDDVPEETGDETAAPPEVRVWPGAATFEVGDEFAMRAEARWGGAGDWIDVTAEADWRSSDGGVASATGGALRALAPGETGVTAAFESAVSAPAAVTVVRDGGLEARGIWVTRWNYASAEDVGTIMTRSAGAGFNQVYFQVRGRADAFYRSTLEPWASELSGTLGEDPGWDPLGTAVDEAHARGLELHAWLNAFPCWSGTTPPRHTTPEHVYNAHRDWLVADDSGTPMALNSSYVFLSPGNPEVRAHVAAVVREIDERYDVDGIHLDYVRYPGPEYSHDAASEASYAAALAVRPGLSYGDWQREQIADLVAGAYGAVGEVGDGTVLSAAVWGIWRNTFGWSSVSQGYVDYFQDPRAWTAAGTIDAVVPMIYWPLTDPPGLRTDFRTLIGDHVAGNPDRFVYAGVHGDYDSFAEISAEIAVARSLGAQGSVMFAYTYLVDHSWWDDFASGPFAEPAAPPAMRWRW